MNILLSKSLLNRLWTPIVDAYTVAFRPNYNSLRTQVSPEAI